MKIREYLKHKKILADGAFGTYFSEINNSTNTLSELSNLDNPEVVIKVHEAYIRAGARLIRSNTFAANTYALKVGTEELTRIISAGYSLAKQAVRNCSLNEPVFIAANIGPIVTSMDDDFTELVEAYKEIIDTFIRCKAEIFLFETFPDIKYIAPLTAYIRKKCGKEVFIMTQFCLNKYGYTKSGISGVRLLDELRQNNNIDSIGFNCGIGCGHMYQLLLKMQLKGNKFISVMPNSNYPQLIRDRMVYLDNAAYFTRKLNQMGELGIHILGGCCGTNPRYIQLAKEQIDFMKPGFSLRENIEITDLKETIKTINPFYEKLQSKKKVIAVELDPPFDANTELFMERTNSLNALPVDMITLADSPMARGRVDSILMSAKVKNEVQLPVMPHIACRDKNAIGMRGTILGGYIHGIRNLLIVTGDPIPSSDRRDYTGVFDFNSIRLMEFVKEMNKEHFRNEPILYGGAINYGQGNIDKVIERTARKIEAGASYFLTQPIFSDDGIERIRKIKETLDTKILCGIMPLVSYRNALFIKNEVTGIHVPQEIVERYNPEMTKEEGEQIGICLAKELMKKLDAYADGYYFLLPFNRTHLLHSILD